MEKVTAKELRAFIGTHVDFSAVLNTDDNKAYHTLGKIFAGHDVVNHSKEEYVRREPDGRIATTNTVESFFALIKRGVYGTFHHLSKHHLHRYLSEFDFRYNSRDTTDGDRALLAIDGVKGKGFTDLSPPELNRVILGACRR